LSIILSTMTSDITHRINEDTGISLQRIEASIRLIQEGAGIPFIARYRKEATGSLDEPQLRLIAERYLHHGKLTQRRSEILDAIESRELLTPELRGQINECTVAEELEDLYLPYRSKRQSKANLARRRGLEPLADYIHRQFGPLPVNYVAKRFISEAKKVATDRAAIESALYIVAERISEDTSYRKWLRELMLNEGTVEAKATKGKEDQKTKYSMYYNFSEPIAKIPSHRFLAVRRGAREKVLSFSIQIDDQKACTELRSRSKVNPLLPSAGLIEKAIVDAYERLLKPVIQNEVRIILKNRAEGEAIQVFEENLSAILLAAPAGPMTVMGIDPSLKGGSRVAVVSGDGSLEEHHRLHLKEPRKQSPQPAPKSAANLGDGSAAQAPVAAQKESVPEDTAKPAIESEASPEQTQSQGSAQSDTATPADVKSDSPETGENVAAVESEAPEVVAGVTPADVSGETPAVVAGVTPAVVAGEAPAVVAGEAPAVVAGEAPAVVAGEAPAVVAGEAPAVVAGEAPAVVAGEAPAGVAGEAPEAVAGEAPAGVAGEAPAGVAGEASAGVASEAPAVVAGEAPAVVASEVAADIALPEPGATSPVSEAGAGTELEQESTPEAEVEAPEFVNADAAKDGAENAAQDAGRKVEEVPQDVPDPGEVIIEVLKRKQVRGIVVGNGAGSRQAETFVRSLVQKSGLDIFVVVASESASGVFGDSKVTRQEFPDVDAGVRGAVSIARRLQDPLAELVKIDPKSIGVGQYQNDVDQKKLMASLQAVTESAVNRVGADLNEATADQLKYIAGLSEAQAQAIVDYRKSNGPFTSLDQLRQIEGFDDKAFEQPAGFLKIKNGAEPLDRTFIHPESYGIVASIAESIDAPVADIFGSPERIRSIKFRDFETQTDRPTLVDIRDQLIDPGADPRKKFAVPHFRHDVREISDLEKGMELEGRVTNVTNFGAFVDIGVHQDGLVHISELSHSYVSDARLATQVGDVVKVKVIGVDSKQKRISLSAKAAIPKPKPQPRPQDRKRPGTDRARGDERTRRPRTKEAAMPTRKKPRRPPEPVRQLSMEEKIRLLQEKFKGPDNK
jgi:uncharacterized protein